MATESVKLWKTTIAGLELFEAQLFQHRFGKHFHGAYTIGLNEGGRGKCQHQKETHYHYPGSFNCINPGDVHTGAADSEDGWAFRNLYIDSNAIDNLLTQLDWPAHTLPRFSNIVVDDPHLVPVFHQVFTAVKEKTASSLEKQSLLLYFFSQLFFRHAQTPHSLREPKPEPKAIALTRQYIEAHCTEPISINQLADLANLNPYYLIRCFHQQVGLPPHSYKKQCQVLQAKQAIHTEMPLADVATKYGFYDQSHLNRIFKRTFGLSPGRYRKVNSV
ncbi:MAG: AraC family transcriptional regulator [Cyanobacteria bacterium J06634_5]